MQCPKGTCPETSNDPKITVSLIDQENGSVWGFYCNYECALQDSGAALKHLMEGGTMDSIPETKLVEGATPVVDTTPALDDTWHQNQAYANELAKLLSKELKCDSIPQIPTLSTDNKKVQDIRLTFGNIQIKLVNENILIDLQNPDYDLLIPPSDYPVKEIVKQYLGHITATVKQQQIAANTSPF